MNYIISISDDPKYLAIVFSISIENPLTHLLDIEKEHFLYRRGIIIFDLFLCNGKGYNRYASMVYNGSRINKKSFKIEKISEIVKNQSLVFYKILDEKSNGSLEKSILTDNEIASLRMNFQRIEMRENG